MTRLRNYLRFTFIVAVVLTPVACSSTPSPASPTGSFVGATINGRVVSPPPSLNVTVMNTAQSTRVAADGRFNFSSVPPADVRLLFTGSGVSATLPLGTLREGETISITVAVTGGSATLQSPPSRESTPEVELEGPVSNLAGSCPNVTFNVRSERVATTGTTDFDGACSALRNGMVVEVEGPRRTDGVIAAAKVELEDGDDDDDDDEDEGEEEDDSEIEGRISNLGGACPIRTFIVSGRNVETSAATVFRGVTCGMLQNGQRVEVEGSMVSGLLRARKVEVEDNDD